MGSEAQSGARASECKPQSPLSSSGFGAPEFEFNKNLYVVKEICP